MAPTKKGEVTASAPSEPKLGKMAEVLQYMFYDKPLSIKQIAAAANEPYGIVSGRLQALKARGLVKQLSGRGGEWLKAPIP